MSPENIQFLPRSRKVNMWFMPAVHYVGFTPCFGNVIKRVPYRSSENGLRSLIDQLFYLTLYVQFLQSRLEVTRSRIEIDCFRGTGERENENGTTEMERRKKHRFNLIAAMSRTREEEKRHLCLEIMLCRRLDHFE